MAIGEEFPFLGISWFRIHFVENPGMAFGWKLGNTDIAKLALSLFRTIAIGGIIWYLAQLSKRKAPMITVVTIAFILAGAIGNLVDSAFYGIIFSESTFHNIAEFMPEGETYGKFMHGAVVDMFYAPMYSGTYPDWIPWLGGKSLIFFRPVFNFADSAITAGVTLVLIFRKKFLTEEQQTLQDDEEISFINPVDSE